MHPRLKAARRKFSLNGEAISQNAGDLWDVSLQNLNEVPCCSHGGRAGVYRCSFGGWGWGGCSGKALHLLPSSGDVLLASVTLSGGPRGRSSGGKKAGQGQRLLCSFHRCARARTHKRMHTHSQTVWFTNEKQTLFQRKCCASHNCFQALIINFLYKKTNHGVVSLFPDSPPHD